MYIWSFNFGFTINTIKQTLSQKTSALKTVQAMSTLSRISYLRSKLRDKYFISSRYIFSRYTIELTRHYFTVIYSHWPINCRTEPLSIENTDFNAQSASLSLFLVADVCRHWCVLDKWCYLNIAFKMNKHKKTAWNYSTPFLEKSILSITTNKFQAVSKNFKILPYNGVLCFTTHSYYCR